MKNIFVDGYNVINSWSNLKKEKEISLDSARQKLIDILHNYGAIHQCKIMLVFDGYRVVGNLENKYEYNKNITVIFTKSGETADAYIEREIHNIGRRFEVSVVTSDSLEQQTIFQRGATRMSSIEFNNEVKKSQNSLREEISKINSKTRTTLVDSIEDEEVRKKLERIRRNLL